MTISRRYSDGALIPNTLVCEVSRLFIDPRSAGSAKIQPFGSRQHDKATLNKKRFRDLCSLIDAVCLYENLYTLPCTPPSDAHSLQLRTNLFEHGILQVLDDSEAHTAASKAIVDELKQTSTASGKDSEESSEGKNRLSVFSAEGFNDFFAIRNRGSITAEKMSNVRQARPDVITDPTAVYQIMGRTGRALNANSQEQLSKTLVWSMNYQVSGAYESCTSILRDMYYIRMAEQASLSYWPQVDRIGFSKKYPGFVTEDMRKELYQKLSDGMKATIAEIEEDCRPETAFIPPFAAIALSRSSNPGQLLDNILAVREDFHKLRSQLTALEREYTEATSLQDRKKVNYRRKQLLGVAASAFDSAQGLTLEKLIRWTPEVVKPITAPTDPTKYSSALLLQPLEWLMGWWQKRPLSQLLQVAGQSSRIDEYDQLMTKVFGEYWLGEA